MRSVPGLLALALCLSLAATAAVAGAVPPDERSGPPKAPPLRLSLSVPRGAEALELVGFRGAEAISSLYSFELDLRAAAGADVPFDTVLGQPMAVEIRPRGERPRFFHGLVSRFTAGDEDASGRRAYRAEIVPRLWFLTRKRSSRIFQEMTVPDIVGQVLGALPGLDFEMRLEGTYEERNHCVQYRETDFQFVSRLLEEEGIYYYFTHAAAGHTMVLANSPGGHGDLPSPVRYTQKKPTPGHLGGVQGWEKTQEVRSGKATLRDHEFQLPGDSLEVSAVIQEVVVAGQVTHRLSAGGGVGLEIYDYPGGYAERFDGIDRDGAERPDELPKIRDDGQRTVGLRMEEEAAQGLLVRGASTVPSFVPGHKFGLEDHPDGDGSYVITTVRHEAHQPGSESSEGGAGGEYENRFTCIPAGLPYRPLRRTPRPIIAGTQTAVVVGPAGEEIETDKYGRVKVKFHWDREGQSDPDSSCWIRVAALNAGTEAGAIHIPRIGEEVVVAFLEGDPDRPLIVGSVYNPDRPPPSPVGR